MYFVKTSNYISKIYFKNKRRLNVISRCTRIKREKYTLPRSAQGDIGASSNLTKVAILGMVRGSHGPEDT